MQKKLAIINAKFILPIACAVALASVFSPVTHANQSIWNKTLETSSDKWKDGLKRLGKEQLVKELNAFSKSSDNELIPFVSEIFDRKGQFSNQELLASIQNHANALKTREIFVDLFLSKNEHVPDKRDLKSLLRDTRLDKEIKNRIVSQMTFEKNDMNLLKKLLEEDNGLLAFHSLKSISRINEEEAYGISKDILKNYPAQSDFKISMAQKIISRYIKNSRVEPLKVKEFIALNSEIFKKSTNRILKDSSFFALSEMGEPDSLKAILDGSAERELKVFAVEQNFPTLKRALLQSKDEQTLDLVVKAMETLPLKDLIPELSGTEKNVKNPSLKNRLIAVLKTMKENGVQASGKWESKKNGGGK